MAQELLGVMAGLSQPCSRKFAHDAESIGYVFLYAIYKRAISVHREKRCPHCSRSAMCGENTLLEVERPNHEYKELFQVSTIREFHAARKSQLYDLFYPEFGSHSGVAGLQTFALHCKHDFPALQVALVATWTFIRSRSASNTVRDNARMHESNPIVKLLFPTVRDPELFAEQYKRWGIILDIAISTDSGSFDDWKKSNAEAFKFVESVSFLGL